MAARGDQVEVALDVAAARVQVAQVVGTVDDPVVLVAGGEVENVLVRGQNDQGGEAQLGVDFDDVALGVLDRPRAVALGGSEGTGEKKGDGNCNKSFHGYPSGAALG